MARSQEVSRLLKTARSTGSEKEIFRWIVRISEVKPPAEIEQQALAIRRLSGARWRFPVPGPVSRSGLPECSCGWSQGRNL
jgi:hypothetical protein